MGGKFDFGGRIPEIEKKWLNTVETEQNFMSVNHLIEILLITKAYKNINQFQGQLSVLRDVRFRQCPSSRDSIVVTEVVVVKRVLQ